MYRQSLASTLWSKKSDDDSSSVLDKTLGTIYLSGPVTLKQASLFRQQLRVLEAREKCAKVTVEINSPGGEIYAGFMIIDSIELCKKPVLTRVAGIAMSMGGLIAASGAEREALPNSVFMVHQGSSTVSGMFSQMESEMLEIKRTERMYTSYLDKRTGKDPGYWMARCGANDLFLTAQEALEGNLIDRIVQK